MRTSHTSRTLGLTALIILLYSAVEVSAQSPGFVTTNWPWTRGTITSFVIEPTGCILAAGNAVGLFRSCDEGRSWTTVRDVDGAVAEYVADVFVDATTGRILAAGTGPVRTLDSARGRWRVLAPDSPVTARYLVQGGADSVLYAITGDGLYRTSDRGATWRRAYQSERPIPYSRPVAVDRRREIVYVADGVALVRSTDGGATWSRLSDSLWPAAKPHLAVTPGGAVIAADENGNVLRSVDSGRTWRSVDPGAPGQAIRTIHVARSGRAFLVTSVGRVFVSSDEGSTWAEVEAEASGKPLVALVELDDGSVLGGVEFGERSIVRLASVGDSWEFSGSGISGESLGMPAVGREGTVFVPVFASGAFYRTSNDGHDWVRDSTGTPGAVSVALGMTPRNTLLVGLMGVGVARREEGRVDWEISSSSFAGAFERSQTFFYSDPFHRVWVGTGSGVFSSTDDGVTWRPTMQGFQFTAIGVRGDGLILLGTGVGHELIYRSVDDGASYSVASSGLTAGVTAIDFLPNGDPLVATDNGLFVSRDDGMTWAPLSVDPRDTGFVSMVTDRYGAVYAATRNAVYVSRDAAGTWERLTDGLSGTLRGLAIDSSGTLFVATSGAGVLRTESSISSVRIERSEGIPDIERISILRGGDVVSPMNAGRSGRVSVDLFSAAGDRVFSGMINPTGSSTSTVVIPTHDLPSGIYVATLRSDDERITRLIRISE